MRSKTYRAKTMKEALTRVRRDLGGDAVILSAREVRRHRLLGLGSRALVEVTATDTMPSDLAVASRPAPGAQSAGTSWAVMGTHALATSEALHTRFGEELGRLHKMVETLSLHGHIDHLLPDVPTAL